MGRARFWLRWSLRDLRRRWVLVGAIALTVAIGTGAYSGLGSLDNWRRLSNDESFALLRIHDLHVSLNEGSFVPAGELVEAARSGRAGDGVAAAEERLIVPTQVDASTAAEAILVPGLIVGVPADQGAQQVDRVYAKSGRTLRADDAGLPVAVLDYGFAAMNDVAAERAIRVSGDKELELVGLGFAPDYLLQPTRTVFLAGADFAVLYMPRDVAGTIAGRPGQVNDLVLRLQPGADRALVERQLEADLRERLPGVGFSIETRDETDAYRILYEDISNDQQIFSLFALLILGAGTFGAFNLASRIVEAQRREIGVGMALGVAPRTIAIRPLMLGAEIAALGVALGIPLGLAIGRAFVGVYEEAVPLPVWRTPLELDAFVVAAALGLGLPLAATAYPTWRAVRVAPVSALEAGYRAARGGGLAPLLARARLPGDTFARMPLRNVVRAPRRTLLTVLGIAVAITTVVGATGMVDSFFATMAKSDEVVVDPSPSRITAQLVTLLPQDSEPVAAVVRSPVVASADADLQVAATARAGSRSVDLLLGLVDGDSGIWRPRLTEGSFGRGSSGIVLTEKAASDLGVSVGDEIAVDHPFQAGPDTVGTAETRVRVAGLHPNPLRPYAYMDESQSERLGLAGVVNTVSLLPAEGVSGDDVKRALLPIPGVAAVQPVSAASESFEKAISQIADILRITEVVALALALLIAFNTATINADERRREHATMFAFGVRPRTVLRLAMVESVLVGLVATGIGIGLGILVILYVTSVLTPQVLPELGTIVWVAPGTIGLAVLLGVAAVALAPLLTWRRLSRMDVPSTLRVVE